MTFDEFTQKLISEIAKELRTKQTCLEFDDVPTANSSNPVTSDGIKTYVDTAVVNDIRVAEGEFDNTTKKVILTLTNGTVIDFSVADLISGLQSEINSSNKLSADLIDDTSSTNKLTSASEKTSWNNKLDAVTTTFWAERVYTILTDGTQSVRFISLDSLPNSVVLRNSIGALNCADAVYDSHALNMGFYKATFQPKQHQIIANVNDGVNNFKALITIVSPSTIIDTATLLKTYFTTKGFNFANTTKYVVQNIYISKLNISEDGFDENSIGMTYDSNTQTFTSPNISNGATLTIVGVVSDTVKAI